LTFCLLYLWWNIKGRQISSAFRKAQGGVLTFDREIEQSSDLNVPATIKRHIDVGQAISATLLARQSRTVRDAAIHFSTKHGGKKASAHFHAWAAFALEHNSPLIDDFEQVEARIDPFRDVSASDLKERVANVLAKDEGITRGTLSLRSGRIFVRNGPAAVINSLNTVLEPLNGTTSLPDLDLPLNFDDLPRVFAALGDPMVNVYHHAWIEAKNRFSLSQRYCPYNSHKTHSLQSMDRPTVDLCEARFNLSEQHGYFAESLGQVSTTVPMVSFAGLSVHTDILMPHVCYANKNYRLSGSNQNLKPFEERQSSLYWRGSATGLLPRVSTWRHGHRQRFVGLSQAMDIFLRSRRTATTTDDQLTHWITEPARELKLRSLSNLTTMNVNVSFTGYHSCELEPEACVQMQREMPVSPSLPSTAAMDHKYLIDLDGNSQSCRFYRLLETESLVFKQTIWNEWHDDRIIPWVHYVPLSTSYQELPILLDYFQNHPEGQLHAAKIARAGIQLAQTSLRTIDMSIYWYRLLVEYADLLAE
jgi:hypothetical protein